MLWNVWKLMPSGRMISSGVTRSAGCNRCSQVSLAKFAYLNQPSMPMFAREADHQRHAPLRALAAADPERGEVIDRDQPEDQNDELRPPRHVEEQACGEQQITAGRPRQDVEQQPAPPAGKSTKVKVVKSIRYCTPGVWMPISGGICLRDPRAKKFRGRPG